MNAALRILTTGIVLVIFSSCEMDDQPKYKTFDPSSFFADGSSARIPPEHSIPFDLQPKTDNAITRAGLLDGQKNFNAFCAPCHDQVGTGHGVVVQRGFPAPPSLHEDRIRNASDEDLAKIISDGRNLSPAFSDRLSAQQERNIVSYVRALQLSQHASRSDIPAEERSKL